MLEEREMDWMLGGLRLVKPLQLVVGILLLIISLYFWTEIKPKSREAESIEGLRFVRIGGTPVGFDPGICIYMLYTASHSYIGYRLPKTNAPATPTHAQVFPTQRKTGLLQSIRHLNPKHDFKPLVHVEARRSQRNDLDVADAEAHVEPSPAPFFHNACRYFAHLQSMPISNNAAHLHPAPDHFERIRNRLRHEAGRGACCEFGPCAERGRFARRQLFLRPLVQWQDRVRRERRQSHQIPSGVVCEERGAGVGNHAPERGNETAEEIRQAGARDRHVQGMAARPDRRSR